MLTENPAGEALRHAVLGDDLIDADTTTGWAQKFPEAASFRISFSSVRSDTARRSRVFSASRQPFDLVALQEDHFSGGRPIGGTISVFVPTEFWKTIFLQDRSPWIAVPVDALLGPLIAIVTFVCSLGNIPLASIL